MYISQSLTFIGRGSCFNVDYGCCSAYFKNYERNKMFLIDCGGDVFRKIIKNKLLDDVSELNIFITHTHSDHIGSLGSLIEYCYHILKIKPTIYFPNHKSIKRYLTSVKILPYMYNLNENEYLGFDFQIVAFPVKHGEYKECFGYYITDYKRDIYYSGDCNDVDLDQDLTGTGITIESCDEIYQDLTHLDYKNNPHMNINKYLDIVPRELYPRTIGIHIDSKETENLILANGMKLPSLLVRED